MAAYNLDDASYERIRRKLQSSLLNKLGFSKSFPMEMVYAPRSLGGLGLKDLRVLGLVDKIKMLIRHIRAETSVGAAAMIMLEWAQRQAGVTKPLLTTWEEIPHVESGWIQNIRRQLREINGRILIQGISTMGGYRGKDEMIMEGRCKTERYTAKDLKVANLCRLYLQVEWVSEITVTNGDMIWDQGVNTRQRLKTGWPIQDKHSVSS